MGIFDSFLNAIKLNDDFDDEDDDYLDDDYDEDDLSDFEDEEEDYPRPRRRFFGAFHSDDEDEDDEDEDDSEEDLTPPRTARTYGFSKRRNTAEPEPAKRAKPEPVKTERKKPEKKKPEKTKPEKVKTETKSRKPSRVKTETKSRRSSKVTPIRKKNGISGMEVNVIRPSSMEDTREIADDLMAGITVVLNLEGLDIDIAQRVTDFTCGVCYALNGSLQKVSSYIFILTPDGVEISGDYQSILGGSFDLPAMRSTY